jgi:hypothetical protein
MKMDDIEDIPKIQLMLFGFNLYWRRSESSTTIGMSPLKVESQQ